MRLALTVIFIFSLSYSALAQIENPDNPVKFEKVEDESKSPTGIELPAKKRPSLTEIKDKPPMELNLEEERQFDMTKGDGLLDYKTDNAPKAFSKDKEANEKYGRDMNFGELITGSAFVNVKYRDHEYVDGDRIRVFVNDDIVQSDISLGGGFRGIKLPLQQGLNRVDFQALNQGTSGPNTAELHIYNDKGQLISAKEWNLLTGNKATILIVKE